MAKKQVEVPVHQFQAKCLVLLDEVVASGRTVVVTRRGRAVARLVPMEEVVRSSLRGSVVREDDIVSPVDVGWGGWR